MKTSITTGICVVAAAAVVVREMAGLRRRREREQIRELALRRHDDMLAAEAHLLADIEQALGNVRDPGKWRPVQGLAEVVPLPGRDNGGGGAA